MSKFYTKVISNKDLFSECLTLSDCISVLENRLQLLMLYKMHHVLLDPNSNLADDNAVFVCTDPFFANEQGFEEEK